MDLWIRRSVPRLRRVAARRLHGNERGPLALEHLEQRTLLASAFLVDGVLSYEADPGETNRLQVVQSTPNSFSLTDAADVTIVPGANCDTVTANHVTCNAGNAVTEVRVVLGDQDDLASAD